MRRDPMRTFAWACAVAGILIGVGALAYVPYREGAIKRETKEHEARCPVCVRMPYSYEGQRYRELSAEREGLSPWPGVITGAAVTAFGIVLLAIRKPEVPGK